MTSRSRSPRLRPLHLTTTLTMALALALTLTLTATGCGTEPAPDTRAAGPSGSADPAPDRAELEARASAAQLVAEHVWVTEAAGYALARQSVGVLGDDGFGSVYTEPEGGQIKLSVERLPHADADCTDGPAAGGGQELVRAAAANRDRARRKGAAAVYLETWHADIGSSWSSATTPVRTSGVRTT
ncbi:hypothetical protein SBADM41S_02935 [Streptomyces badius]